MAATAFTRITTYSVVDCPACHQLFAITTEFQQRLRNDHQIFYCPSGHTMSYDSKNETEMLRAKLDQAQAEINWQTRRRQNAEADAERARRQSAARKGVITKMRRRIAAGVCPVPGCKRSGFTNVQRHIASQHPDFHDHEETA